MLVGTCYNCSAPAMFTCTVCGRSVCINCYRKDSRLCINCDKRIHDRGHEYDDDEDPENIDPAVFDDGDM